MARPLTLGTLRKLVIVVYAPIRYRRCPSTCPSVTPNSNRCRVGCLSVAKTMSRALWRWNRIAVCRTRSLDIRVHCPFALGKRLLTLKGPAPPAMVNSLCPIGKDTITPLCYKDAVKSCSKTSNLRYSSVAGPGSGPSLTAFGMTGLSVVTLPRHSTIPPFR